MKIYAEKFIETEYGLVRIDDISAIQRYGSGQDSVKIMLAISGTRDMIEFGTFRKGKEVTKKFEELVSVLDEYYKSKKDEI